MNQPICGICLKPRTYAGSRYIIIVNMHVCEGCAVEWELRQQMAAVGWMKGAERPATEPPDVMEDLNEPIGGTD